jgi:uridine kinase
MNIDDHNRISTTDTRLLRRIVRDHAFRGAKAIETIKMWPSVRAGEEEYIFPYQESCDSMFNSGLIYELGAMKEIAQALLGEIGEDIPEYAEAIRLHRFLDYFVQIMTDDIPSNSILREFIGGSCFRV